jgi:hypothetical protein
MMANISNSASQAGQYSSDPFTEARDPPGLTDGFEDDLENRPLLDESQPCLCIDPKLLQHSTESSGDDLEPGLKENSTEQEVSPPVPRSRTSSLLSTTSWQSDCGNEMPPSGKPLNLVQLKKPSDCLEDQEGHLMEPSQQAVMSSGSSGEEEVNAMAASDANKALRASGDAMAVDHGDVNRKDPSQQVMVSSIAPPGSVDAMAVEEEGVNGKEPLQQVVVSSCSAGEGEVNTTDASDRKKASPASADAMAVDREGGNGTDPSQQMGLSSALAGEASDLNRTSPGSADSMAVDDGRGDEMAVEDAVVESKKSSPSAGDSMDLGESDGSGAIVSKSKSSKVGNGEPPTAIEKTNDMVGVESNETDWSLDCVEPFVPRRSSRLVEVKNQQTVKPIRTRKISRGRRNPASKKGDVHLKAGSPIIPYTCQSTK